MDPGLKQTVVIPAIKLEPPVYDTLLMTSCVTIKLLYADVLCGNELWYFVLLYTVILNCVVPTIVSRRFV